MCMSVTALSAFWIGASVLASGLNVAWAIVLRFIFLRTSMIK